MIIIDSREQLPLKFPNKYETKVEKLDYGDYHIEGTDTYFERKSALDLFGTLGKGHARFKKELGRCLTDNKVMVILVECSEGRILMKDFKGAENIKTMSGVTVIKILRTLNTKYGIGTIFCKNRVEMRRIITDQEVEQ